MVSSQEQVFDPAHIAIRANLLVSVAKRVRGSCFLLMREGQREESTGLRFQVFDQVKGDAVIGDFEESEFFACLDELGFRVGSGEVYERYTYCVGQGL